MKKAPSRFLGGASHFMVGPPGFEPRTKGGGGCHDGLSNCSGRMRHNRGSGGNHRAIPQQQVNCISAKEKPGAPCEASRVISSTMLPDRPGHRTPYDTRRPPHAQPRMATAPASAFERPKTISLPWHNPGKATRDGTYRLQTARPSRLPVAFNRPDGFRTTRAWTTRSPSRRARRS